MPKGGQYKKIIKQLLLITGLAGPVTAFLLIYLVVAKQPISTLFASDGSVGVGVTVIPDNPIKDTEPLTPGAQLPTTNSFKSSEYQLITPLAEEADTNIVKETVVTAPLVTIQGVVAYPYSTIILEIASEHYHVTLESDAYGQWSWTNYGTPFAPGEHTVTVFNFSPLGQMGARKVFVEYHRFMVADIGSDQKPALLRLNKKTIVPIIDLDEHARNNFLSGSGETLYVFEMAMENDQRVYEVGEDISVQLTVVPIQNGAPTEMAMKHELYFLNTNGVPYKLADAFDDRVTVEMGTFTKQFSIKPVISSGDYFFKTTAHIQNNTYVQIVPFTIAPAKFVTIGGNIVEKKDINRVLLWNIAFVLFALGFILSIAIAEYHRLISSPPMDEETLKKSGYL